MKVEIKFGIKGRERRFKKKIKRKFEKKESWLLFLKKKTSL